MDIPFKCRIVFFLKNEWNLVDFLLKSIFSDEDSELLRSTRPRGVGFGLDGFSTTNSFFMESFGEVC